MIFLGNDVECHFCKTEECCKPAKPAETCRSENVNCGVGMKFVVANKEKSCSTCVQNDPDCCVPTTCKDFVCNTGFQNIGSRLCTHCEHNECCKQTKTCKTEGVGCGFGHRDKAGTKDVECNTCALNDDACCEPLTCGNFGFTCP